MKVACSLCDYIKITSDQIWFELNTLQFVVIYSVQHHKESQFSSVGLLLCFALHSIVSCFYFVLPLCLITPCTNQFGTKRKSTWENFTEKWNHTKFTLSGTICPLRQNLCKWMNSEKNLQFPQPQSQGLWKIPRLGMFSIKAVYSPAWNWRTTPRMTLHFFNAELEWVACKSLKC